MGLFCYFLVLFSVPHFFPCPDFLRPRAPDQQEGAGQEAQAAEAVQVQDPLMEAQDNKCRATTH